MAKYLFNSSPQGAGSACLGDGDASGEDHIIRLGTRPEQEKATRKLFCLSCASRFLSCAPLSRSRPHPQLV